MSTLLGASTIGLALLGMYCTVWALDNITAQLKRIATALEAKTGG